MAAEVLMLVVPLLVITNTIWMIVFRRASHRLDRSQEDLRESHADVKSATDKLVASERARVDDMKKLIERDDRFRNRLLEKIGDDKSADSGPGI
jgi:ABC-type transport system involved in cytochrome bd biosynthesis fused ATPase/permease subunit